MAMSLLKPTGLPTETLPQRQTAPRINTAALGWVKARRLGVFRGMMIGSMDSVLGAPLVLGLGTPEIAGTVESASPIAKSVDGNVRQNLSRTARRAHLAPFECWRSG